MFKDLDLFTNIFYHKNKRDFNLCDCYGLCYLFNKHILNKELPLYLNEKIELDTEVDAVVQDKKNDFVKVSIGRELAGDIVLMRIKNQPIHVGVIVQSGLMLHIMEGKHSSIESYKTTKWKNKIDSFWRYKL